jgi:hypothetical protein
MVLTQKEVTSEELAVDAKVRRRMEFSIMTSFYFHALILERFEKKYSQHVIQVFCCE